MTQHFDDGFNGTGQMKENGAVVAAMSWVAQAGDSGRALSGSLTRPAVGSAAVAPSAAAHDFQMDRWVSQVARMGPKPR